MNFKRERERERERERGRERERTVKQTNFSGGIPPLKKVDTMKY